MQTSLSSPERFYRPELDVIRFFAFLLVFFCHALPRSGDLSLYCLPKKITSLYFVFLSVSSYGLCLFFTLSAFLICELLLREREAVGTINVKQFYIRRILRIWPLYYLALAIGVIIAFLPGNFHRDFEGFAWFAIFMGSWHSSLYGAIQSPVYPLWSISVEEQFYLVVPWAAKFLNRKSLYGFCAIIILVSNAELYSLGRAKAIGYRIWTDSLVQFECFAAGILLCLVLHGRMPRIPLWQRLTLIAGSGILWITAAHGLHHGFSFISENLGSWSLIGGRALVSLGCVLLLLAFLGVQPKLLPGWTIYLGRISFGLYVYHGFALGLTHHHLLDRLYINQIPIFPLKVILTAGFTVAFPFGVTLLVAMLSYRYFETPFLKMKRRHAVIESQPIVGIG